jgi:type II secretory pathway pseudopilin PulG
MKCSKFGTNVDFKKGVIQMETVTSFELIMLLVGVHTLAVRILGGRLVAKRVIVAGSLLLPSAMLTLLFADEALGDFFALCVTILCFILPMLTVANVKRTRLFYVSVLYFGSMAAVLVLCRWMVLLLEMSPLTEMIISVVLQGILLSAVVLFSTRSVFYRARQHIDLVPVKWKQLLLFSVWFSAIFTFFLSEYTAASPPSVWLVPAVFTGMVQIILVGITWPLIIFGVSLSTIQQKETARHDEQLQAQIRHYEQFLQANTELRKFKHDFDNVLLGIAGYVQDGDLRGAKSLIDECRRTTLSEHTTIKTGNVATDALIADKQARASEYSAEIYFTGIVPSEYVSSLDLCVIFGNALDNAIRACAEQPGKKAISVTSDMRNGFLFIRISNPVKKDVPIRDNMIFTTKVDKDNHGIGLASINRAVQKYDGKMKLSCEDKLFTIEVVLDLNPLL